MIINELEPFKQYLPAIQQKNREAGLQPERSNTFAATLKEFIGDVNAVQKEAGIQTEKLIKGEPVDIHDVMISAEKAKTSFQLLLELRNKAMDLYHEVNRLQV